jgi:hypothetical protein
VIPRCFQSDADEAQMWVPAYFGPSGLAWRGCGREPCLRVSSSELISSVGEFFRFRLGGRFGPWPRESLRSLRRCWLGNAEDPKVRRRRPHRLRSPLYRRAPPGGPLSGSASTARVFRCR